MIAAILSYVLAALLALLPITNPLSAAPLVLSITADLTDEERQRQLKRACIYMALILITFLLLGALIMDFFSISIPGLRIAGGLIISYLGFRMLFPPENGPLPSAARQEAKRKQDVSFTPLAMPSLAGPGSIAAVISLSSSIHNNVVLPLWLGYASVCIGIMLTALINWLLLRVAFKLYWRLGETGLNAIARLMGFFLICIGIQFFIDGIAGLLRDPSFWPGAAV
ncbi:MarC family NAAT transporter [Jeongeupia wiesaeckerbachi]|uniref:MarC family NAAT transporter n=1 Tax=Jeongeupia wiesaeckerbachi TaxID=3051218 RepID=UPI003D807C2A